MDEITSLMLQQALSSGLQDHGVTDDIFKTEAISNVLGQMTSMLNEALTAATAKNVATQQKLSDAQQEAAKTNNEVQQLTKVVKSMTEACLDRAGAQTLPQQDMNAEPESTAPSAPQPEQPAPDAGMIPPPDMGNVPPAPDMGAMSPAPDAGMVPPPDMGNVPPAPDMMQVDPNMLGALQPRF